MRKAEAPRAAPSTTPHLHRGVSEKSVCAAFAAESWCDDHHEAALFIQRIFQLRRKRRKHRLDQIRFTPKYPHSQLSASARVIQVYWRQRQRQKLYARFVKGEKRLFVQRPSASAELNAAAGFMSSLASRQASQGKVRRANQLIRRATFLRSSAKLLRAGAQASTPPLATPPFPSLPNFAPLPQPMPKGVRRLLLLLHLRLHLLRCLLCPNPLHLSCRVQGSVTLGVAVRPLYFLGISHGYGWPFSVGCPCKFGSGYVLQRVHAKRRSSDHAAETCTEMYCNIGAKIACDFSSYGEIPK